MNKLAYGTITAILMVGVAQGQENCQTLRGMLQGRLELPAGWVSQVYGTLGEAGVLDVLRGELRAIEPGNTVSDSGVGTELNVKYRLDFGANGSIVFQVPYGLLVEPPNAPRGPGIGTYLGVGKILSGTGRFQSGFWSATGTVLMEGPYVVWFDDPSNPATVQGRFSATVIIRACMPVR
jgi:hypothetical protein